MPKSKSIRLVIDTNLWISFIISKKLNDLETIIFSNNCKVLFSSELIDEIKATIEKPKLKKYFSRNALNEMFTVFEPYIDFIEVKSNVKLCRDPKDDFLLSLAKDGKANFILTGDNDLLAIGNFEKTEILKMTTFIDRFKG